MWGLGNITGNLADMQPDNITLQRIEAIHPKLRAELRQIYAEICQVLTGKLGCRFVQVFRTFAEQDALYAQGRTKPGQKVTDAKGGLSWHNYGTAVDFCLLNDKNQDGKITSDEIIWKEGTDLDNDTIIDWLEVVKIFLKYGWRWGKSWGDAPHLEKNFGYTIRQVLDKYNKGDVTIEGGRKYVNL